MPLLSIMLSTNFSFQWVLRNTIRRMKHFEVKRDKSALGHTTPLGRPRSVYKSDIDRRFWDKIAKWLWRSRSMPPVFHTSQKISKFTVGANLVFKSITSYCPDKSNFLEFWVKMAKMTLKFKFNDIYFRQQPRVSQDACVVRRFQLKSVTSKRVDKVMFTDGRKQRQYPHSLKSQVVKTSLQSILLPSLIHSAI